jgi:ABC-2 type transport system ATP-binding protein
MAPTASSAPLIEIDGLEKVYRKGLLRGGFRALEGVTLSVERGLVFGLLGPNGAGKTTLVKILLGLVRPTAGRAVVLGRPAGDPAARARIGYLPEAHRLPGYLTGRQVVLLFGMLQGRPSTEIQARLPALLERVDMSAGADRKLKQYSKGMQQRIGLAQALVHEPELVFLDEPTDGVDPVGRAAVRGMVEELKRRGTTVFINSHLLMEVERVCDRVVIMDRGRIVREGSVAELTPRTGLVRLEIEPCPQDLERLLAGVGTGLARREHGFELKLDAHEIDALVDRLRAAGISIRSLTQGRLDLEQAFIETVRQGPSQGPAPAAGGRA